MPDPKKHLRHGGRRRGRFMAEINVVPYIDVMLVLLVIFMITTPLLQQGVKVELPRAAAEPLPPDAKEPILVSVDKDSRVFLNFGPEEQRKQPVDEGQLLHRAAAIHRHNPELLFYIQGDRAVPYEKIVLVMAVLQRAGIESVGLLTNPLPPPPEPALGQP